MTLYKAEDLSFSYPGMQGERAVLDQLSFTIDAGEFVCLSGPSGSGKSTLLNILGLIENPERGRLLFNGQDICLMSSRSLSHARRHDLAFIFQDFQLIEVLSVEENVGYFLSRQGIKAERRRELVKLYLEEVQLSSFSQRLPRELSGGQRQRVGIARALAKRPAVIIADEPTASLDHKTGQNIMEALRRAWDKYHTTIVLASHDPMVFNFVSRVIRLEDGHIL